MLGGRIEEQKGSWKWQSSLGQKATDIAGTIGERAPSRQGFIKLCSPDLWGKMSPEDRLTSARRYINEGSRDVKREVTSPSLYDELVQHNEFLAGIFDSKSVFDLFISEDINPPASLRLFSENNFLLEALSKHYGGDIKQMDHGHVWVVKADKRLANIIENAATYSPLLNGDDKKKLGDYFRKHEQFWRDEEAQEKEWEQEIESKGKWLSGMFEIGSEMNARSFIGSGKEGEYDRGRLDITFTDGSLERVQTLTESLTIFESIYRVGEHNSWRVKLSDRKAKILALGMASDYSPSRQEFITLAEKWDKLTTEQKVEEARMFQEGTTSERQALVDQSVYDQLVKNAEFVAGIIDGRGYMALVRRGEDLRELYPTIKVASTNESLLKALGKKFGGNLDEDNTSFQWTVSQSTANQLYEFIKPHLVLRKEKAREVFERGSHDELNNLVLRVLAVDLSSMSVESVWNRMEKIAGISEY